LELIVLTKEWGETCPISSKKAALGGQLLL